MHLFRIMRPVQIRSRIREHRRNSQEYRLISCERYFCGCDSNPRFINSSLPGICINWRGLLSGTSCIITVTENGTLSSDMNLRNVWIRQSFSRRHVEPCIALTIIIFMERELLLSVKPVGHANASITYLFLNETWV